MTFSYWSLNQFSKTLSNFETALTANVVSFSASLEKKTGPVSISPEIPEVSAIPAPTSEVGAPTESVGVDLELSFTFPKKGAEVYIGCTYPISWQSSTTVNLLETILVDAGTSQSVGPIVSGLATENMIAEDLQNLNWKVGVVWPGAYYIKVSKINDTDIEFKSKVFTITRIPPGTDTDEQEKICKESGGSF